MQNGLKNRKILISAELKIKMSSESEEIYLSYCILIENVKIKLGVCQMDNLKISKEKSSNISITNTES